MKKSITTILSESIALKQAVLSSDAIGRIEQAVLTIAAALKAGGTLLLFGNGGSAADSQHIAAEMVGRFRKERRPLAAIALSTNTSNITALANDYGYEVVFARQIEALGKTGDVALGLSTSGTSRNVIEGLRKAKALGLKTIAFSGSASKKDSPLAQCADNVIAVPSRNAARIQETHIVIGHIIAELVEAECSK